MMENILQDINNLATWKLIQYRILVIRQISLLLYFLAKYDENGRRTAKELSPPNRRSTVHIFMS